MGGVVRKKENDSCKLLLLLLFFFEPTIFLIKKKKKREKKRIKKNKKKIPKREKLRKNRPVNLGKGNIPKIGHDEIHHPIPFAFNGCLSLPRLRGQQQRVGYRYELKCN